MITIPAPSPLPASPSTNLILFCCILEIPCFSIEVWCEKEGRNRNIKVSRKERKSTSCSPKSLYKVIYCSPFSPFLLLFYLFLCYSFLSFFFNGRTKPIWTQKDASLFLLFSFCYCSIILNWIRGWVQRATKRKWRGNTSKWDYHKCIWWHVSFGSFDKGLRDRGRPLEGVSRRCILFYLCKDNYMRACAL